MPAYPPILCPNCLEPFTSQNKNNAFCSLRCQEAGKAVRYARRQFAKFADGSIPEDIREAMRFKFAHAAAGGYDAKARQLPEVVRAEVKRRDMDTCVSCGALGVDIDHIDGPSSDLTNLQLLCKPCHNKKTNESIGKSSDEAGRTYAAELRVRSLLLLPETPGDHYNWDALRGEWFEMCWDYGVDEWKVEWPAWLANNMEVTDQNIFGGQ
jgi:hypothetical protein